jgi:hypothetical protein
MDFQTAAALSASSLLLRIISICDEVFSVVLLYVTLSYLKHICTNTSTTCMHETSTFL